MSSCGQHYLKTINSKDLKLHACSKAGNLIVWFQVSRRSRTEIAWGSTKLKDIGFQYRFDAKVILDESDKCAKKLDEFGATK